MVEFRTQKGLFKLTHWANYLIADGQWRPWRCNSGLRSSYAKASFDQDFTEQLGWISMGQISKGNPTWVKGGTSPNPKGRPRDAVAALLDRIASPNAEVEIGIIAAAARGDMDDPSQPGAKIRVPAKLRVQCAQWIAERRHGKAPNSLDIDVSGQVEHSSTVDIERLSLTELAELKRLVQKGRVSQLVEGEIVQAEIPEPRPTIDAPVTGTNRTI